MHIFGIIQIGYMLKMFCLHNNLVESSHSIPDTYNFGMKTECYSLILLLYNSCKKNTKPKAEYDRKEPY